jgi:predicted glutamine amidotransferase
LGGWFVRSILTVKLLAPKEVSTKDLMLRTLLAQRQAQEDESAGALQAAQSALAAVVLQRGQAEETLRQLRAQQTQLAPGRRRVQDLRREETQKKKVEDAGVFLASLRREEGERQQTMLQAQSRFTLAAQERRATESALEVLKKSQERARDQKQEEERDEAWRLLQTLRGVK